MIRSELLINAGRRVDNTHLSACGIADDDKLPVDDVRILFTVNVVPHDEMFAVVRNGSIIGGRELVRP